jgi:hypothetical protein
VSDAWQGPGWWLASDRKWYPPESYPGACPPPPLGAPTASTNAWAVASLVLGILWLGGLGSILALVFGLVARRQMTKAPGAQTGRAMAMAGIILGVIGIAGAVLLCIAFVQALNFTISG